MAHFPKPWLRKGRGWYVEINGRQVKLDDERGPAFEKYHVIMAGVGQPSSIGTTVMSVLDDFMDWCRRHRSPGTCHSYKGRLDSFWQHLKATKNERLLVDCLKPFHVEEWVATHPTWNPGMIRGNMVALQRAMNWAVKQGKIDKSPLVNLEKPPQGRRENVITEEDYQKLLAMSDRWFHDVLVVAWETGARPQEIVRVEARHCREDRWVFPIDESKGKKRSRVVHLTAAAQEITARLVAENPKGPIFRNRRKKPWHPWAVNCRFCRYQKKLGRKIALVDFRHTFVTRLLKANVDAITIGVLCGHADLSMIAKTYSHVDQDSDHLQRALKKSS